MDNPYQCPRCAKRGKTWEGDDPKCGFNAVGKFMPGNWNCATLNDLRQLDTAMGASFPVWRFLAEVKRIYADDERMEVIPIPSVDFADDSNPTFLILCWYKSRGQLPFARVVFADYEEKDITLDQAEAILVHCGCKP
jgi:hypothetical protein